MRTKLVAAFLAFMRLAARGGQGVTGTVSGTIKDAQGACSRRHRHTDQ